MSLLKVSSSPHVRHEDTTRVLMSDVIIALLPAFLWGIFLFGRRAAFLTAVSVVSCVIFEYLYNRLIKKSSPIGDLSAVVSGILLAFNVPVACPAWMMVVGAFFAMVIVKGLFGGIGKNIVNPVLAARAFLFASWPSHMTAYSDALNRIGSLSFGAVDTETAATSLTVLKAGSLPELNIRDLLIGNMAGCIGEVSSLLLIAGGIYLLVRRVITWHIPVSFVATVALLTFVFAPAEVDAVRYMTYEILSGGLLLGAVFMATDYVTSPVTKWGRIIFGVGCGIITVFIRMKGGYPEGVSFAILIMNLFVWYLDKATKPVKFGGGKKA